ncbi:hypothetical protein, partial [Ligaoa zhengdingensis]|uniref:hypothetical protein n=1 Tax=Ligaoa zhengdingensis TaxID=2763658 RepID=UPI0031B9EB05
AEPLNSSSFDFNMWIPDSFPVQREGVLFSSSDKVCEVSTYGLKGVRRYSKIVLNFDFVVGVRCGLMERLK